MTKYKELLWDGEGRGGGGYHNSSLYVVYSSMSIRYFPVNLWYLQAKCYHITVMATLLL